MLRTVQWRFYEVAFCSPSSLSFGSTSCCLPPFSFSHFTEYLLCLMTAFVTASQVVVQGWSPSTRPSNQSRHPLSWSLVTLLFTQSLNHDWNLVWRRLATTGWHCQQTAKHDYKLSYSKTAGRDRLFRSPLITTDRRRSERRTQAFPRDLASWPRENWGESEGNLSPHFHADFLRGLGI